ncbi:Rho termination protein [Desulfonema ishimotonii]|uniref:Rho termination protein n=1 Tax=Desulfonema ishimotonii TaxID=45657 RepID=A0A401FT69_9BACT|nr:Rho termination factor N-terminal domain-containing protein [Desulfonema ishimotonii]GBC60161.1 Rho termination protein [Desulfonema ishimotonii]
MGGKKEGAKEKPLEKMTSKDLREVAKEIDGIVGAHGMNKPELISAIRKARGIEEPAGKKGGADVREIKKKIKELKVKRAQAIETDDQKMAGIYRKRIVRLKKKTRRAA